MMWRAAVLGVALAGIAQAQPRAADRELPKLAAPAGWTLDVKLSAQLTLVLRKEPRPNQSGAITEAYRPPAGAVALYATRIELKAPAAQRDAVASAELGELAAAARRAGKVAVEQSAQQADPAAKQLDAIVRWKGADTGITDHSRTIVAADAEVVVAVTGQCLIGADAPADLATLCVAALATLDTGIPPAQRVPLSITTEAPAAPARSGDTPALGDGSRIPLPPRVVPQRPAPPPQEDRRMIYLGGGLVVIALVFWWNRRRRERFERRDEDADDLHAAAREPAAKDDKEKEV